MMGPLFLLAGLALGQANVAEPARVTVLLPSQARLYVDDLFCDLISDTRSFDTPALLPGRDYFYILKAVIERDGRTVEVSKKVMLRAGKRSVVDFGDMIGKETASSPGPDQPPSLDNYHLVPKGSTPSLVVVRMKGDNLEILRTHMEWQTRQEIKSVKDKDGKEKQVTFTVSVPVFKSSWEQLDPRTVQVFDTEDQVVPADKWSELLGKDKVVLLSEDGQKVNPVYRDLFRKDTLMLVRTRQGYALAPPTVAPSGKKNPETPPSAASKPRPIPVDGPSPFLLLVRLDNRGNLHIRQCAETPFFTTGMKEIRTEAGEVRQVVYQIQNNMLSVRLMEFPVQQFKIYNSDAQEIGADDLRKMMHREQVVLVAQDGKPVDPLYREHMKKGTLILIPSPESLRYFLVAGYPAMAPSASPIPSSPKPQPTAPLPPANLRPAPVVPAPKARPTVVPPVAPPASPPARPRDEFEPSVTEQEILDLANAERKKAGAPPLTASPLLMEAARRHSANMAEQNTLNHTLDGKGIAERLKDAGYAWSRCGENIAWGQRTPAEAIDCWMNSPGHRNNLLGTDYTQIGVAVAATKDGQKYWTMVLARP